MANEQNFHPKVVGVTFRKGKVSHQCASTSSDDEINAKEDLGTRRTIRRTRQSEGVTCQSGGATRQGDGATRPSDGLTRQSDGYYYPFREQLGQQSSDVTANGGACGPQWAGPDDPSLGVRVNRPNVTGLGSPVTLWRYTRLKQ